MRNPVLRPALALLLCLALGTSAAWAEEGADDGSVRIATGAELRILDPHLDSSTHMGMHVTRACFEGLVRIDPRTLRPVPGLASSWTISEDRRTWTFVMRAGAVWSDGTPITSHDAAASLRRALSAELQGPFATLLGRIEGAAIWHGHPAAVVALRGGGRRQGMIKRLHAALLRYPEGVDEKLWRRWLELRDLPEALVGAPEKGVHDALFGEPRAHSAAEIRALLHELDAAANRLAKEHAVVRADFGKTRGIRASDDGRTLTIRLERPMPWLPDVLALPVGAIVPPVARRDVEGTTTWWEQPDCPFSGPYRFAGRTRVGRIPRLRLERNPRYWDAASVKAPAISLLLGCDGTQCLQLFTEGRVDWTTGWPTALHAALRKTPVFRLQAASIAYYYVLNCRHPALGDARVRRALALAVDREAVLAEMPDLLAEPAYRLVPDGMPGYPGPAEMQRFDPEAAKALLAAAGHPGGRGLPPIELLFNRSDNHRAVAAAVAKQWKAHLGVEVRMRWADWNSFLRKRARGSYGVARAGWIADYPDPTTFLELFVSDSLQNAGRWSDERYDGLLREAEASGDPAARLALLAQAEQRMLLDGVACIPLYWFRSGALVQPWLKGYRTQSEGPSPVPNALDLHPFRGLWIEGRTK